VGQKGGTIITSFAGGAIKKMFLIVISLSQSKILRVGPLEIFSCASF